METEPLNKITDGKPRVKTYLETGLPGSIQKAIEEYQQGEKEQVLYLDCLWDELYGAINSNLWAGLITEEQADYLREKYLGLNGKKEVVVSCVIVKVKGAKPCTEKKMKLKIPALLCGLPLPMRQVFFIPYPRSRMKRRGPSVICGLILEATDMNSGIPGGPVITKDNTVLPLNSI